MAWSLVGHGSTGFADGNAGHVYTLPNGAPGVGDLDILTINSDTVVSSTPSGWSVATSFVNSQGSYLYYRFAVGGEGSTVTVTTSGNFDTALTWARFTGGQAFDVAVNAHADGASDVTTPAVSTGTLAGTGELVVAFGALHSGGTPSAPSWSSGYTALDAVTQVAVTAYTAYNANAGTAAEAPNVTWTTSVSDRYILVAAFKPAATAPTLPPSGTRRRAAVPAALVRRGRNPAPVRAQVNPPHPFVEVQQSRRVRGLLARRGRTVAPVPAQVVVTPAAYPPQSLRSRVKAYRLTRGHQAQPVPAQVVATAPAIVPGKARQAVVRLLAVRRGRSTSTPAEQLPAPPRPPARRRPAAPIRGRRVGAVPTPQLAPVPLIQRIRARFARVARGRVWRPVPPQVILTPPAFPPQGIKGRFRPWGLRHRGTSTNGWMPASAHSCTTPRPFVGTTARPGAGTTARPDTGITEPPCGS